MQNNRPLLGTPEQIKKCLDKYVVGQEEAKINLSNAHFLHESQIMLRMQGRNYTDRTNLLLIGPTGSGKTYLAETLSKVSGIPLVHVDCARLTSVGYAGVDPFEAVEHGLTLNGIKGSDDAIILLDEIDKVAIPSGKSEEAHYRSIQSALMAILDKKPFLQDIKHSLSPVKEVDLTNKFIIATGAFSTIQRFNKQTVHQDLSRSGMLPELINRFISIDVMEEISSEKMHEFLMNNLSEKTQFLYDVFRTTGNKLEFSDLEIQAIKARIKDGNVRQLDAIIFDILKPKIHGLRYKSYTSVQPLIRRFNDDNTTPPNNNNPF